MRTLADFVKEKRNGVKLTQEAFAERAGVALTVIRKIEQGHCLKKIETTFSMILNSDYRSHY